MEQYVPGVRNIDTLEATKRRRKGWYFVAGAFVYAVAVFLLLVPQLLMLVVGVFAYLAALHFLEARHQFSVSNGLHGLYDMGEGLKHTDEKEEHRAKDRKHAELIRMRAIGIGILAGFLAYFVLV